jgi:hypothetical protein
MSTDNVTPIRAGAKPPMSESAKPAKAKGRRGLSRAQLEERITDQRNRLDTLGNLIGVTRGQLAEGAYGQATISLEDCHGTLEIAAEVLAEILNALEPMNLFNP